MAQSPERFLAQLAKGKPIPAIVLQGSDAYLLDLCRKKIVDAYVPGGLRDWALSRMSVRESGWDEVIGRAKMLPMLAQQQVIFVEDIASVERLGDKARDEIVGMFSAYLDEPAPFTILVLEAKSLDARLKFSKLLAEKALIVELAVSGEAAAALAEQMAIDLGTKIDRAAASQLADMVNGEPARIHMEVEKLATYALGAPSITRDDVEKLVVAERRSDVWKMADMIAEGRRSDVFAFLENLLWEGEQPAMIVGALASAYRRMVEARELPPTLNKFQAAQRLRTWAEVAEPALRNAHRFTKKRLLAALGLLADADSQLKSSNPNPRALLEFLVVRL